MTATLFAVARLPLSSISDARSGSNARICRSTRRPLRPGRRPRRAGPGRTRSAARPGPALAALIGDRLRDVDPVRRDPHGPRHAVGVAHLLGELVDKSLALFGCHRGDLVCDALLADRRPARDDVGQRHRPTPCRCRRRGGTCGAFNASTMSLGGCRRRLRQAGRGTRRSRSRSTLARYRRAAAGHRNQQRGTWHRRRPSRRRRPTKPSARAAPTRSNTSSRAEAICAAPSLAATAAVIRHRVAAVPPAEIIAPRLRAASAADPVQKSWLPSIPRPTASTRACRSAAAASQASATRRSDSGCHASACGTVGRFTAGRSDRRPAGRRARTRRPTYVPRPPTRACSRRRR